ncbi:hypothetical protein BU600_11810 [Staphylococcus arlettae]|uniref:hypothetical protein n=2 Tax=Staphylococcus arlettae TaxID=29378 RepID=UPI000D19A814|nr:hypothetical protein [Staphylococcus arlettae]MCD8841173.1 hypothetical protein [Staphylococcus arlettae]PTH25181.1 hypothetical protein BU605_09390 [Staphylococcus arlettae]PTH34822.1 hypothetical protein BU592_03980 [Staphylococcus arlettae]PTH45869.1 hypothetical protein BU596_06405 [Staphylococcus arlettae]PTH55555.1 hypothetical protein BU601_06780 [Staphylococcus arlettae]
MFANYQNLNELEDIYITEKKQVAKEFQKLTELRHQIRRENEQSYALFLHLKEKMGYSNEASGRMLRNLEEYEHEANQQIRQNELKLENYKDELKRAYVKQIEKIGDED